MSTDRIKNTDLRVLVAQTGGRLRTDVAIDALDEIKRIPTTSATERHTVPTPDTTRKKPAPKNPPLFFGGADSRLETLRQVLAVYERQGEPTDANEAALVHRICRAMAGVPPGYKVSQIGQRKAKGSGTDVGYPDLSIRCAEWPRGVCVRLEAKTLTGRVEPGQQELADEGGSFIVRSVADVLRALIEVEGDETK